MLVKCLYVVERRSQWTWASLGRSRYPGLPINVSIIFSILSGESEWYECLV